MFDALHAVGDTCQAGIVAGRGFLGTAPQIGVELFSPKRLQLVEHVGRVTLVERFYFEGVGAVPADGSMKGKLGAVA